MGALAVNVQDLASSWWHYVVSLERALSRERAEFKDSCLIAADIAFNASGKNPLGWNQLFEVLQHSQSLVSRGLLSNQEQLSKFVWDQIEEGVKATATTFLGGEGETIEQFMHRQAEVMSAVANFNEQIEKIKDEFGFQFHSPDYKLVAETPSFLMYQVLPLKPGVKVRDDLKPMLLVPPYMLGVNILAFLPFENKSYAHAFAVRRSADFGHDIFSRLKGVRGTGQASHTAALREQGVRATPFAYGCPAVPRARRPTRSRCCSWRKLPTTTSARRSRFSVPIWTPVRLPLLARAGTRSQSRPTSTRSVFATFSRERETTTEPSKSFGTRSCSPATACSGTRHSAGSI